MGQPVYRFALPPNVHTELRVHGVSGPDPATVLETAATFHVAGDDLTGFARRLGNGGHGPVDDVDRMGGYLQRKDELGNRVLRRMEAFSWRGVSSGAAARALWLLLGPFALLNFAAWMHPERPKRASATVATPAPRVDQWNDGAVKAYHAVLRALAVVFTVMLFLVVAAAFVEVPSHRTHSCGSTGWLASNCGHVWRAGGLVAALAALGVLVGLARTTAIRYDQVTAKGGTAAPTTPLETQRFWHAKQSVGRQRTVHMLAAGATITWVALQPRFGTTSSARTWSIVAFAALCGVAAVAVAVPWASMASDLGAPGDAALPDEPTSGHTWASTWWGRLLIGAVAVVLAWAVTGPAAAASTTDPFRLRAALLVVLLAVSAGSLAAGGIIAATRVPSAADDPNRPLLDGWAPALVPFVAWLWAAFLGSALIAVATRLADNASNVHSPGFQTLVNLGARVVPVGVVVTAVWAGVLYLHARTVVTPMVGPRLAPDMYLENGVMTGRPSAMTGAYTSACATAWTVRHAYLCVVPLALTGLAWLAAPVAVLWSGAHVKDTGALPNWFAAALAVVPPAIVGIYRNSGRRRAVGVVWDVVTFWPRAVHPLAPPCYAERAVPQLVDRHAALTDGSGTVLLSAHSQGSLMSAATVLQLQTGLSRTALVTYGCQLSFLYARGFPAYCGRTALQALARRLDVPLVFAPPQRESGPLDGGPPTVPPPPSRWLNLFRLTDYLGDRVTVPGYVNVNREVGDPSYVRLRQTPTPIGGKPPHPDEVGLVPAISVAVGDLVGNGAPLRHSDYPASPEYAAAAQQLDAVLGWLPVATVGVTTS